MIDPSAAVARFVADPSRRNRDAVISAYTYLCRRGARKFRRAESDPADLEQVAAIGLIKATDRYRPERTTPFEAYAWMMIVGELMHYVRDHERAIRVPRRLRALERRYVDVWEVLAARDHAEPTAHDLADALGVSVADVEEVRASHAPFLADALSLRACAAPLSIEERLTIAIAVEALSARERTVVLGTYAAGLSQSEIALAIGLSQSQVSKILSRALGKLQRSVA
jgi:RNA polymerase sigma-B factor